MQQDRFGIDSRRIAKAIQEFMHNSDKNEHATEMEADCPALDRSPAPSHTYSPKKVEAKARHTRSTATTDVQLAPRLDPEGP